LKAKNYLKKLNYFEEKRMKHVRSAMLQIKIIGKIDQNYYMLRYKAKMQEIMISWKKKWNFAGKAAFFRWFSETKEIQLY